MCRFADARPLAAALGCVLLAGSLVLPADTVARANTVARADETPWPLPMPDTWPVEALRPNSHPLVPTVQDLQRVAVSSLSEKGGHVQVDASVAFGKDQAVVRPVARKRLAELAAELAAQPPSTVEVVGHTDDLGSAAHGLDLSRRRAQAVATALGASLERHTVTVVGKGEAQPVVENTDEASRARNRRVEIRVRPR